MTQIKKKRVCVCVCVCVCNQSWRGRVGADYERP